MDADNMDASAEPSICQFLELPAEIRLRVADILCDEHLPSAIRLLESSRELHALLHDHVEMAVAVHALTWSKASTADCCSVSDDLRRVTKVPGMSMQVPWAAGSGLPTVGRIAFRFHPALYPEGTARNLVLGVCDAPCLNGWGLLVDSGRIARLQRDESGEWTQTDPPDGWPDGDLERLLPPEVRCTNGTIEITFDADRGILEFGLIDGREPQHRLPRERRYVAPITFPSGVPLRPFSYLLQRDDSVTLSMFWSRVFRPV